MKIVALSDIHSNSIALTACLEEIKSMDIEGIVFLGDYVSDCPNPGATLTILSEVQRKYQTWFIRGNREEYFLDYQAGKFDDWSYTSYKGSLLYTYEHLKKKDLEWFKSLPNTRVIKLPGTKPITIAHGSPSCTRELLDAKMENTKESLRKCETEYLLCGHTHRQFIYRHEGKTLFNPGSVGVAIGVKKQAHYMVLTWENEEWIGEKRNVPYSFEELKKGFAKSNLMEKGKVWPKAILKSIETGINYGPLCAKRAYDLAVQHGEKIRDRIVPEKYWIMAAKEYHVIE